MTEQVELDAHTRSQLESVVDGLVAHTDGSLHRHVLREMVFDNYATLAETARVTTFLPVLAGNLTLSQIEAAGAAIAGGDEGEVPSVLVLDEHNSTRSQAARPSLAALRRRAPCRGAGAPTSCPSAC